MNLRPRSLQGSLPATPHRRPELMGTIMETPRFFPLNAWYIAAWSHEVGKREPLARTVCSNKMVLWRKADGSLAALEDACWHRLLPLSMGWLEGETIVCRYHGLGVRRQRSMHAHAVAGQSQPGGESTQLSRARPLSLCLGVARRSGASRSRTGARPALERRSRMGGRRQDPVREMRLSAVRRQPDGPHARSPSCTPPASATSTSPRRR